MTTNTYKITLSEHRLKNYWVKEIKAGRHPGVIRETMCRDYKIKSFNVEAATIEEARSIGSKACDAYKDIHCVYDIEVLAQRTKLPKEKTDFTGGLIYAMIMGGMLFGIANPKIGYPVAAVGAAAGVALIGVPLVKDVTHIRRAIKSSDETT